ncbi:hypothetical protein NA78x_001701 [Anatilimnocola sp. NA78]|uniref:hypothetical protein n=1 Tax=Anatilimnocola sp. NA78 TaxID=3415683 RepID=UPI003CE4C649
MASDHLVHDVEEFCSLLEASRLLSAEELHGLLTRFQRGQSQFGATLTGLTQFLVAAGAITCWQCALLRNRQYKGFFLAGCVILDVLRYEGDHTRFLAREVESKRLVALCVKPHNGPNGIEHWTEEI